MLKVAILGCGGIGNTHAKVLTRLADRVKITSLCDVVEEKAGAYNERYAQNKASVFTDFREMFERTDVDLVYICLPPFAHTDEVQIAAERGIHVFVEKPIALSMGLANKMVGAVDRYGVKSQVGFMYRFGEAVEQVKKMLESGEAGPPGLMTGHYLCNSLHAPWWREREKSGGQIVEQIIHTFDTIRYFLGEVKTVFSRMDNVFHRDVERYTVEDVSATVITFSNGAVASVTGTNGGIPGKWLSSYELVAKNITVQFADANQAKLFRTDRSPAEEEQIEGGTDIMMAETLDLLKAIEEDGSTRTPIIEGARTLELVLAANESAETGKIVELS
jgi:predicted dehydrogenase